MIDFNVEMKPKSFKTVMFKLDRDDEDGEAARYEDFMMTLNPYDPESNLFINEVSKSWNRDQLIIHIEYIEYEKVEQKRDW